MMYETMIAKIFKRYLDMQGLFFSDDNLCELVDVYLDCQEWDNDILVTGITETEMVDWIKHTSEVGRIDSKNEREMGIKKTLISCIEILTSIRESSKKEFLNFTLQTKCSNIANINNNKL